MTAPQILALLPHRAALRAAARAKRKEADRAEALAVAAEAEADAVAGVTVFRGAGGPYPLLEHRRERWADIYPAPDDHARTASIRTASDPLEVYFHNGLTHAPIRRYPSRRQALRAARLWVAAGRLPDA